MSEELDLDERELCPDGACIGVIGDDGRCKECGREGTVPRRAAGVGRIDDAPHDDDDDDDDHAHDDDHDARGRGGRFGAERQLCPDGACVGVIGPEGVCGECGRAAVPLDERSAGLRSDEEIADELARNIQKGSIPPAPDDFGDRRLCPDGSCIGLIGRSGRCKECGRAA